MNKNSKKLSNTNIKNAEIIRKKNFNTVPVIDGTQGDAAIADLFKGTDKAGTFMSLKCVVYYVNYRSWHQSSKIQVVS